MAPLFQSKSIPSAEIMRLRQFLRWGLILTSMSAILMFVLQLVFPSPINLTLAIACLLLMLCYVWGKWQAAQHHIEAAAISVWVGLWSICLVSIWIVPVSFPALAVTLVLPVALGLPYVKKRTLLAGIAISLVLSAVISFLSLRQLHFQVESLPEWIFSVNSAVFVPLISGLIFLLLWQYNSRLNDTLAETQIANEALKQSEKKLAVKALESENLARQAQLVNYLATQIRNSLELEKILETTVTEIRTLLQVDRCQFSWFRRNGLSASWEVIAEARIKSLPRLVGNYSLNWESPVIQKLAALELVRIDDCNTLDDLDSQREMQEVGMVSVLSIPIQTASGDIGIVSCSNSQWVHHWSDSEVELLQAVVVQLEIAINQAELFAQTCEAAEIARSQAQQIERTLYELQQAQSQLVQSEKMSSLGQLVAGVAHEINNPVNFIYGNLEHAETYTADLLGLVKLYQEKIFDLPPEIQEEIEAIELEFLVEDLPKLLSSMRVGADRIREIVKSLRNFSRLDESAMKVVDIHEGLDSTLMILQNRLKAKSDRPAIQVIADYGNIPPVECYPGQLNQVFMNLIANAIDAIEESIESKRREMGKLDKISPWIRISTQQDGDRVIISIADSGFGMTPEVREKLFSPFFTTKEIGKGTGLGLAISQSIVTDKHHGNLSCISALGKGTEFRIEIPIHQARFKSPAIAGKKQQAV